MFYFVNDKNIILHTFFPKIILKNINRIHKYYTIVTSGFPFCAILSLFLPLSPPTLLCESQKSRKGAFFRLWHVHTEFTYWHNGRLCVGLLLLLLFPSRSLVSYIVIVLGWQPPRRWWWWCRWPPMIGIPADLSVRRFGCTPSRTLRAIGPDRSSRGIVRCGARLFHFCLWWG